MKPSHHEIISVICRVTGIPLEMRCRLFDMPIVLLLSLNLGMTPQKFPRIQPRNRMGSMTGKIPTKQQLGHCAKKIGADRYPIGF